MTRFHVPSLSALFSPQTLLQNHRHHRAPGCSLSASFLPATQRSLHASQRLLLKGSPADSQTYYDALNVPFGASAADIKKSFYSLSKKYHPDHNPADPHAPRRFMRISEAYSVLGQADKRAVYDRDVMRHHAVRPQHAGHRPAAASYHSTGPAGGRPASGLSRRRGTFKGPPPSFYRNTGTGGAARADTTNATGGSGPAGKTQHQRGPGFGTGHGPGNVNPDDTGSRLHPNTPHFDHVSNERTQRRMDKRMAARRAANEEDRGGFAPGTEPSVALGFMVMSAALVAGVVVPALAFGDGISTKGARKPAQKSVKDSASHTPGPA